jgi:NADH dehydrogenase FAD-containing subunit
MEKTRLVILGGGLAGLPMALLLEKKKKLLKHLDVVMIDQRDYFEMNCESVRFLVKPEIHLEVP